MMDKNLDAYNRPRMGWPCWCQHNTCSQKSLDCWFNYPLVLIWLLKFNVMDKTLDQELFNRHPPAPLDWPCGCQHDPWSLKSLDCWFNYPLVLIYRLKSLQWLLIVVANGGVLFTKWQKAEWVLVVVAKGWVDFSSGGKRLSGFW